MPASLVITPEASNDLDKSADFYLEKGGIELALRFYGVVDEASSLILSQPEIGALRNFTHPDLAHVRMWSMKHFEDHLIFYRSQGNQIEIIRVVHGARDLEDLFNQ